MTETQEIFPGRGKMIGYNTRREIYFARVLINFARPPFNYTQFVVVLYKN